MDAMKIESGFMQFLISKIIKKSLIKKTRNPDLEFSFIFNGPLTYESDKAQIHCHIDADIYMDREEFEKLIKEMI